MQMMSNDSRTEVVIIGSKAEFLNLASFLDSGGGSISIENKSRPSLQGYPQALNAIKICSIPCGKVSNGVSQGSELRLQGSTIALKILGENVRAFANEDTEGVHETVKRHLHLEFIEESIMLSEEFIPITLYHSESF